MSYNLYFSKRKLISVKFFFFYNGTVVTYDDYVELIGENTGDTSTTNSNNPGNNNLDPMDNSGTTINTSGETMELLEVLMTNLDQE